MSYDPRFVQAAAERVRSQMSEKCEADSVNQAAGLAAGFMRRTGTRPVDIISGIDVQFLANGFLVAPRMDYLGPSTRNIAHVARDKDELLKLIGEMIDAHAT